MGRVREPLKVVVQRNFERLGWKKALLSPVAVWQWVVPVPLRASFFIQVVPEHTLCPAPCASVHSGITGPVIPEGPALGQPCMGLEG